VFVGRGPDGGAPGVFGIDALEVVGGGSGEFLPVTPLIGGQENGAGAADDPADFTSGSGAGEEIGRDATFLLFPGVAGIEAKFDLAVGPDAPGVGIRGEDDNAATGKIIGRSWEEQAWRAARTTTNTRAEIARARTRFTVGPPFSPGMRDSSFIPGRTEKSSRDAGQLQGGAK